MRVRHYKWEGGESLEKDKFVPRLIKEEEVIRGHIHEFIW